MCTGASEPSCHTDEHVTTTLCSSKAITLREDTQGVKAKRLWQQGECSVPYRCHAHPSSRFRLLPDPYPRLHRAVVVAVGCPPRRCLGLHHDHHDGWVKHGDDGYDTEKGEEGQARGWWHRRQPRQHPGPQGHRTLYVDRLTCARVQWCHGVDVVIGTASPVSSRVCTVRASRLGDKTPTNQESNRQTVQPYDSYVVFTKETP